MADFENLTLDITDGLATITFNRPDKLNALSSGLKGDFLWAIREVAGKYSGARCLMITGAGKGFCAGADLTEGRSDPGANLIDSYQPFLQELAALEIPIVSAVNGVAAGAGMSIAITADFIVAAKSAYFLQAFVNIGLVPDAGSTFVLPRLIGTAKAKRMMMLGEKVYADTAFDWGMIHAVAEDDALTEEAAALATKLANGPTIALGSIRKLMAASADNSYAEQLHAEALAQRRAGQTHDCAEGVSAFIQKRPAAFKGQ